jgi:hypothetical protein
MSYANQATSMIVQVSNPNSWCEFTVLHGLVSKSLTQGTKGAARLGLSVVSASLTYPYSPPHLSPASFTKFEDKPLTRINPSNCQQDTSSDKSNPSHSEKRDPQRGYVASKYGQGRGSEVPHLSAQQESTHHRHGWPHVPRILQMHRPCTPLLIMYLASV